MLRKLKYRIFKSGKYPEIIMSDDFTNLSDFFIKYESLIELGYVVFLDEFTGLHDKNGKEIYEGDLVDKQYRNFNVTDCDPVPVVLGTGTDSDGWISQNWLGWLAGGSSLLDIHALCEVIGNIHEQDSK